MCCRCCAAPSPPTNRASAAPWANSSGGEGTAATRTRTDAGVPGFGPGLDTARADAVIPVLGLLLGIDDNELNDLAGVAG